MRYSDFLENLGKMNHRPISTKKQAKVKKLIFN
jgi:hypothetical protein